MNMNITTGLLEAFLKCRTKCYLQAHEVVATENVYADWVRTQSEVFRSEGIKRLVAGVAPDKFLTSTHAVETGRSAKWQLAPDFVTRSGNLQCSCHAVERNPPDGRGQPAQFTPIRFVFRNKLTRNDKLLLAFDSLVISKVFSREVALGRIVYRILRQVSNFSPLFIGESSLTVYRH